MQRLCKSLTILALPVLAMAEGRVCDAQFVNPEDQYWVAGRHETDEFPHSDGIRAVAIHITLQDAEENLVSARVFGYPDVDNDHYADMVELTTDNKELWGRIKTPANKRSTLKLMNNALGIEVYMTMMPIRGMEDPIVVCRIKFKEKGDAPCDEVPTDDVLVEEDLGTTAAGEPASDPTYEEPPTM